LLTRISSVMISSKLDKSNLSAHTIPP